MAAHLGTIRCLFRPLRVWPKLASAILALVVYGFIVRAAVALGHLPRIEWGAESTILDGLVLGFLIAFPNHQAYDRWWEARKLWGQLVNDARNLSLKVRSLPTINSPERDALGGRGN
jgi:putative membrane protein